MVRIATGVMIAALVAACACKGKTDTLGGGGGGTGTASGSGSGTGSASADACPGIEAGVRALYAAEAKATGAGDKNPTFVDDNVAMVMADCAKDPGRVVTCAGGTKSVAQLEKECLIPIDDEGTEGEAIH